MLTEFLTARIAEDEGVARSAAYMWRNEWSSEDVGVTTHIERHDPARVLAECEAKRRVMEIHYDGAGNIYGPDTHFCATCSDGVDYLAWPCQTLLAFALPYTDHPDYDESWRP